MIARYSILLLLTFSIGMKVSIAQNCQIEIEGTIIDTDTKEPLSYATIVHKNTGKGTITSDKGCFVLKNICPNDTTLIICQHVGCEPKQFVFVFSKDTSIVLDMPHHSHTFEDIDFIMDYHDDENTQAKSVLEGSELDKQKGKSLGEALKKINGVTSLETGSTISKPVVHGLHSQRVLVFNNNVRVEGQSWGSEHAPEIDPFLANQISVIKGAGSLRYSSDAIGGVILVEPKPLPITPGVSGNMHFFTFSNGRSGASSLDLEGNHKKINWLSWRIQGTLKRGGNAKTPNYFMKNTGFKESNVSWTLGARGKKFGIETYFSLFSSDVAIFSASHIGNLTDLEEAFQSSTPLESSGFTYRIDRPYQNIYHELFKTKAHWWLGEESKLSLMMSRQFNYRAEFDKLHINSVEDVPEVEFELTTHSGELLFEHHIHEVVSSTIGITTQQQSNTSDGSRYFIPDFVSSNSGIFAIERFDRDKTSLELGIRYDYKTLKSWIWENKQFSTPELQFGNIAYNIGGIYRFDKGLDAHVNFGTTWRAPLPNELYSDGVHHGAAAIERGKNDLTYEYAKEASLQFNYHKSDKVNAEITFYHKLIDDFIYLNPTGKTELTIRGAFPVFEYQQANSIFQGIDLSFSYRIVKRLKWNSKSSIVRAFLVSDQSFLPLIPSDRSYNGLQYSFKKGKKVRNGFIEFGIQNVARQSRVLAGSDFIDPPPSYFLINMQTGCSINIGKQRFDLGLEVKNLLDQSYREYMNRFRYFSDDIGRNITLNLKVPFNLNNNQNEN